MAEGLRELLVGDWWRYAISGLGALLLAVGVGSVLIGVGARVAVVVRDSTELYGIFGCTSLGVTARETPESVVITVTDEGPGVDVDPDRLFEPNTRGRDSEGDGLGLFIAKLVVERYDGTISYVDSNDEGATFEIEIPTQSRREYDFPPGGALQ